MQTLAGAMEESYTYLSIRRTLLMCFLIFSAAEANTIEKVVGSKVMLPCRNESLSSLTQLTWKMNEILLFAYNPNKPLHTSSKAWNLNLNMSLSEDELYRLIIERVNQSHTGNYSCEISTTARVLEERWQLIITEHDKAEQPLLLILVAVIVPCVCCLIFILMFTITRRSCKHQAEDSPTAEVKQTEEIYENCLDIYEN